MSNIAPEQLTKLINQNPVIILRHLLRGRQWEYDGEIYELSEDNHLCWVFHREPDNEKILVSVNVAINDFIQMARQTPLDVTAIMSAELALQQETRRKS